MGGKNFFLLSADSCEVFEFFINSQNFEKVYNGDSGVERNSLLLHYVIDNPPFAFQKIPLLYEQIRQFIAVKVDVAPSDVKLIGSAKTGFSISKKEFGRAYNSNSDLDFAIINENLFKLLEKDYITWKDKFCKGEIQPNKGEEKYWKANVSTLKNSIKKKYIDANKLPARKRICPTAQNVLNTMYLIKTNLQKYNSISVRKVSVRVYSDFMSFYSQTIFNISYVMENRI